MLWPPPSCCHTWGWCRQLCRIHQQCPPQDKTQDTSQAARPRPHHTGGDHHRLGLDVDRRECCVSGSRNTPDLNKLDTRDLGLSKILGIYVDHRLCTFHRAWWRLFLLHSFLSNSLCPPSQFHYKIVLSTHRGSLYSFCNFSTQIFTHLFPAATVQFLTVKF